MRWPLVFPASFAIVAILSLCQPCLAQGKQIDYCNLIAKDVLERPTLASSKNLLIKNVIDPTNNPSCFFQASLSTPQAHAKAEAAITPARVSLWNAVVGLTGSQQQGSSLSSSGGTNAVSKPSGPTSLVEEIGGTNSTTGTSSSTFQLSPGTILTNLALTGRDYLCLTKGKPDGCISASLLKTLTPLTIKVTANTSGSQTATGTATSPSSASTSQPVTINSKGTNGPGAGFGGLTVQYSITGSKSKSGVASLTSQDKSAIGKGSNATSASSSDVSYYADELKSLWNTSNALGKCDAYARWSNPENNGLVAELDKIEGESNSRADQTLKLQQVIEQQYQKLLTDMMNSPDCQPALDHFKEFYAAILVAKTYEDFAAVQQSPAKPELALEYDLNTPQNKPSYSSAKITGSWQFGKTPASAAHSAKTASNQVSADRKQTQQAIRDYADKQAGALAAKNAGNAAAVAKQLSANAKPAAQDNAQPWSFTVTGTADIYNAAPPSTIPSASHLRDIQAGAEIAYLFSPSEKSGALRQFIGSVTAAAAYSYQDQTSPAMLTGAALSDFTGLPASTTTAYAKRGVIHLGQVRLGFGTGSNLTYPLAFTYSNRTELVVHPTWGVQFGVSYNLTSLFNSGGAKNSAASADKVGAAGSTGGN